MIAAIYYESDGYKPDKNKIMGRQVAGNSFLKGYLNIQKILNSGFIQIKGVALKIFTIWQEKIGDKKK